MKKKEEKTPTEPLTPLLNSSKNIQSVVMRIKRTSTNLSRNETTDLDDNRISKEYESAEKQQKFKGKTKSLQEKLDTDDSDFEQIFDPSMPYQ